MADNGNGLKPTRAGRYAVAAFIGGLTLVIVVGMMFFEYELQEWEQNVLIGLSAVLMTAIKDFVAFVLKGRREDD